MTGQTRRGLVLDGLVIAGLLGVIGGGWALDWRIGLMATGSLCLVAAAGVALLERQSRR